MPQPSIVEQRVFWNDWVNRSFTWEDNPDNARRGAYVMREVIGLGRTDLNILDVGCGTGWLAREMTQFGDVTGTDLATDVIVTLKQKFPSLRWISGDFMDIDVKEDYFDVLTCLETIAHVPDQEAFVERMASLLKPGGTLLLTTQNEYIWTRTSALKPPGPGQIRNWPSPDKLRDLFEDNFKVKKILTCAPGGDLGWPGFINGRWPWAIGRRLLGRPRWIHFLEKIGIGKSLFLHAVKR